MTDKIINGKFLWSVAAHLQRNMTSFPASKSNFCTQKKGRENENKMEDVLLLLHKFPPNIDPRNQAAVTQLRLPAGRALQKLAKKKRVSTSHLAVTSFLSV